MLAIPSAARVRPWLGRLPTRCRGLAAPSKREPLSHDVDQTTGLCAGGLVRIGRCASLRKGLGAFAATDIATGDELGTYAGERISFGELLMRYGGAGGVDGAPGGYEHANRQAAWTAEREARGVGVTGSYLFNAGACPSTGRDVLIDGEDPQFANWTRYVNHSARPNLVIERQVLAGGTAPVVSFVAQRPIAPGEELTFDYADGYDLQEVLDFDD